MKTHYSIFQFFAGLVILFLINLPQVNAQSQGPHNPDSLWNNASAGNVTWSNPVMNAADSDALYDTVILSSPGSKRSQYLMATHFHFSIPSNAPVNGITVEIYGHSLASIGANIISFGKLIKANAIQNDSLMGVSLNFTNNRWDTLGGCTNLWHDSTLTGANIDDSGFGVAYYAMLGNYSNTAYINAIKMTVCYTMPNGAETLQQTRIPEGNIFPNPSPGRVYIDYTGNYSIKIYDALMRLVYSGQYNGPQYVNFPGLKSGIYTIRITGKQYNDSKKLLIQHS